MSETHQEWKSTVFCEMHLHSHSAQRPKTPWWFREFTQGRGPHQALWSVLQLGLLEDGRKGLRSLSSCVKTLERVGQSHRLLIAKPL